MIGASASAIAVCTGIGLSVTSEVALYRSPILRRARHLPALRLAFVVQRRRSRRRAQDLQAHAGLLNAARAQPLRSGIYVDRAMASIRLGGEHRRKTRAGNRFVKENLE
jgi:hypothetical protein